MLLRGEGRYTDNLNLAGQLYGVMVRSRIAHGRGGICPIPGSGDALRCP